MARTDKQENPAITGPNGVTEVPTPDSVLNFQFQGIAVASVIIGTWLGLLVLSLFVVPLGWSTWWWPVLALPLQTFLNVGLFITAHDSMHGSLAPRHAWLNDAFGRLALMLYALFSFDFLKKFHRQHHIDPASARDPDYHDVNTPSNFWPWYVRFMSHYVTWRQWLGMPLVFVVLWLGVNISPVKLFVLWVIPAWLSSFQLFYFGTFLPHRNMHLRYHDGHRAQTNQMSLIASFLTCYHFGKHWEHHAYPFIPWWKLGPMSANARLYSHTNSHGNSGSPVPKQAEASSSA
jgi:beta-carotene ketolase (CrtW type)